MSSQYSAASLHRSKEPARRRIKAPELDTSALIRDNALTLIGRVLNPAEQRVELLLSALPLLWSLKGKVFGSDLGRNCFQFRFELEDDLTEVLANRPYQFCRWMLVLQRWEPIISTTFPSQIPFWIRLHGLPLHYWHEQMLYNIAFDMGTLDDYSITKSAIKKRVLLDTFKPLLKEAVIEFSSGEDVVVELEYEKLDRHCSICNSLSHLDPLCSQRVVEDRPAEPTQPKEPRRNQPSKVREEYRHNTSSQSKTVSENAPPPLQPKSG